MLEGLEITIVNKSKAFDPFFKARIDPEFFQKRYILMYAKILALHNDLISNIALVTDGEHGNAVTQTEGYSKYFGARNVLDGILNDNGVEYITKEHHEKLKKTALKPRDVLISCVGANIGFASIVPDNIGIGNIVRNVALIRSNTQINNEYLLAYFRSEYGKSLYYRMNTGNAQPLVSLDYINTIPIYKPSQDFQLAIKKLITNSLENNELSKQTYSSAEIYLLKIIGLNDFKLSDDPVNTKSLKDSFLTTGRLDAEYYQKKYEEVVSHIKAQKYDRLSNLVTIKKSIEPGSDAYSDEGLPFMRVSDFNKLGLSEPDKKLSSAFCSDNAALIKKLKPKKETILFSKDGSVGTAYMLRKDEDLITSGAILHLTVKDKNEIIPEYLTLALNSKLVQMQAERDAGGSIILHWRIGEIGNVVVPIIDYTKQKQIAALVEESFRLKKQSEQLLETAKRAVEIAIEQDEDAAMLYILQNVISQVKPKFILQVLVSDQLTDFDLKEATDDFLLGEVVPIYIVQETKPFACLEWAIPTAIVVVLGQFAGGFFGEMGKDAYVALKNGIKKLAKKVRPINFRLVGTKPIDESNTQSKTFSIETMTKDKTHIKFLFDNEGSMDDWELWIDKATGLLEENYLQDDSEMQRKLNAMEKPISTPVFWVYKKETDSWEPHDLKKVARSQYENHIKNQPES